MPQLWMPEAQRHDLKNHAPTDGRYPAKAIAHCTWDVAASKAKPQPHVSFGRLLSYFTGAGASVAPHILWDPFTGQHAQFFPADSRSLSLADGTGGTRTNRAGRVVLQIEAVFFPHTLYDGKAYAALDDTPCKGWEELHAWVSSWGVPNRWPMGEPTDLKPHRDEHTWETEGGWYPHRDVPENDHVDPGSWPALLPMGQPAPPKSGPTAHPSHPFPQGIHPGGKSPSAKPLQRALKATGWMGHKVEESSTYGPVTQRAVAGFNAKHGFNSRGVSWDPAIGPHGWALLMTLAYGAR
ncbi:endolysin [Streptomyces sp. NPDC005093]